MGHNANKRLACDRCRDQKLRCIRPDQSSEPCVRCQRAGAHCFTGSARPLGRPRLPTHAPSNPRHTARGAARRGRGAREPSSASAGTAGTAAQSPPSMPPWPLASELPDMSGTTSPDDARLSATPGQVVAAAGFPLDAPHGGVESWAQLGLDSLLDLSLLPENDMLGSAELDVLGEMDDDRPLAADRQLAVCDPADVSGGIYGIKDSPLPTTEVPPADTIVGLSRISERITRQLAQVHVYALQPSPTMQVDCSAKLHTSADNPLVETMQSTAEFVAILKTLAASAPTTHSSSAMVARPPARTAMAASDTHLLPGLDYPPPPPPPPPPLGRDGGPQPGPAPPLHTPTALLLLANYLQLMQLYNALFAHLCGALGTLPRDEIDAFQVQTGIPDIGAGMPAIPGSLYIKLVLQVIEHQLETMERLLGLPAESRLSGQAGDGNGIFSHADAARLVRVAIQEGACGTTDAGKPLVEALREKMDWVREMLRG